MPMYKTGRKALLLANNPNNPNNPNSNRSHRPTLLTYSMACTNATTDVNNALHSAGDACPVLELAFGAYMN